MKSATLIKRSEVYSNTTYTHDTNDAFLLLFATAINNASNVNCSVSKKTGNYEITKLYNSGVVSRGGGTFSDTILTMDGLYIISNIKYGDTISIKCEFKGSYYIFAI